MDAGRNFNKGQVHKMPLHNEEKAPPPLLKKRPPYREKASCEEKNGPHMENCICDFSWGRASAYSCPPPPPPCGYLWTDVPIRSTPCNC